MFSKLKSLKPLPTYMIGIGLGFIAGFFREDYKVIYYGLLSLAFASVIWGIVKYFSDSSQRS
ncbi:MAG: hypothetical protein ITG00_12295 [Flavobacterium sp.]|nr:hypothetical protein [Flavobacterium sp.]